MQWLLQEFIYLLVLEVEYHFSKIILSSWRLWENELEIQTPGRLYSTRTRIYFFLIFENSVFGPNVC